MMRYGIFGLVGIVGLALIYFGGFGGGTESFGKPELFGGAKDIIDKDVRKSTEENVDDMMLWGGFILLAFAGAGMLMMYMTRPEKKEDGFVGKD
jgi:hypothetical protein